MGSGRPETPRIGRRHVCISGFTQSLQRASGLENLWLMLRDEHEGGACRVSLREWDSDWDAFAEHVWRTGLGGDVDVRVYAYSWGAGHGFVRLARELGARGIQIRYAVLSDPVYRRWYALWRSVWSPLLGEPTIEVPANVREVAYLIQRRNIPHGHRLVAEHPKTVIHEPRTLDYSHQYMDDAIEFHEASIDIARSKG